MPLTVQSGWSFSFFSVFICQFVVLFSDLWNDTIWHCKAISTSSSSDLVEAVYSLVTLFVTYHITVYCYQEEENKIFATTKASSPHFLYLPGWFFLWQSLFHYSLSFLRNFFYTSPSLNLPLFSHPHFYVSSIIWSTHSTFIFEPIRGIF